MPIMQERPLRAARAHDQADGDAGDHARISGCIRTRRCEGVGSRVPGAFGGGGHLSNPAESKRNRALSPAIWAVSREVSKPVISGVSPS
jgi:hypothetical protein